MKIFSEITILVDKKHVISPYFLSWENFHQNTILTTVQEIFLSGKRDWENIKHDHVLCKSFWDMQYCTKYIYTVQDENINSNWTRNMMNVRGFIVIILEKQTFPWSPKVATIQLSNTDIQVTSNKHKRSSNTVGRKERLSQTLSLW